MATTITWATGPYRYETAGKGFIDQVEWRVTGTDGDTSDSSTYGSVSLDRPEDSDMVERATFGTKENLVTAIKAKLGADAVTAAETACETAVASLKAPVHSYATAES